MGLTSDLRVMYHLMFGRVRGVDHAARLEAFYRHQAGAYDDFRRRLLHGREELMAGLDLPAGGRLLDLGGGTGSNIETLGDRLLPLQEVIIVDLCQPLLQVAEERIRQRGWSNVRTVRADATTFEPEGGLVDAVTCSYALTMIPNWFEVIDRAYALLKPEGMFGVVDFHVSRKWPAPGLRRHHGWTRWFWPMWFGFDNVFLNPDHLPYLQSRFHTVRLEERFGRVPYMFGLRAPYYLYLGRKTSQESV